MNVRRFIVPVAVIGALGLSVFGVEETIRTGGKDGGPVDGGNQPRLGDSASGFHGQGFTQEAPVGNGGPASGPTPTPDKRCKGVYGEYYGQGTPAPFSGITCLEGNVRPGIDRWLVPPDVDAWGAPIPGFEALVDRP